MGVQRLSRNPNVTQLVSGRVSIHTHDSLRSHLPALSGSVPNHHSGPVSAAEDTLSHQIQGSLDALLHRVGHPGSAGWACKPSLWAIPAPFQLPSHWPSWALCADSDVS